MRVHPHIERIVLIDALARCKVVKMRKPQDGLRRRSRATRSLESGGAQQTSLRTRDFDDPHSFLIPSFLDCIQALLTIMNLCVYSSDVDDRLIPYPFLVCLST